MASVTLPVVAAKRGRQTAAQGLGIDVVVALALAVATFLPGVSSWEDVKLGWAAWLLLVGKSVVQAVVSWVLRRFGDQSGFADKAHEVVGGEVVAPAVEASEPDAGLADPGLPEDDPLTDPGLPDAGLAGIDRMVGPSYAADDDTVEGPSVIPDSEGIATN